MANGNLGPNDLAAIEGVVLKHTQPLHRSMGRLERKVGKLDGRLSEHLEETRGEGKGILVRAFAGMFNRLQGWHILVALGMIAVVVVVLCLCGHWPPFMHCD